MANIVDPDQAPNYAMSGQGLIKCFLKTVCPKTRFWNLDASWYILHLQHFIVDKKFRNAKWALSFFFVVDVVLLLFFFFFCS